MGNCKSFLNSEKTIPKSTPKMITIQKRNQVKTKEEIRAELLSQLAYMKERIDNLKTEDSNNSNTK